MTCITVAPSGCAFGRLHSAHGSVRCAGLGDKSSCVKLLASRSSLKPIRARGPMGAGAASAEASQAYVRRVLTCAACWCATRAPNRWRLGALPRSVFSSRRRAGPSLAVAARPGGSRGPALVGRWSLWADASSTHRRRRGRSLHNAIVTVTVSVQPLEEVRAIQVGWANYHLGYDDRQGKAA